MRAPWPMAVAQKCGRLRLAAAGLALAVRVLGSVDGAYQGVSGLLASYSFEGGFQSGAGTTADAALHGMPRDVRLVADGVDGQAALFDGSAEIAAALDVGSSALVDCTLAAWVRPAEVTVDRQTTARFRRVACRACANEACDQAGGRCRCACISAPYSGWPSHQTERVSLPSHLHSPRFGLQACRLRCRSRRCGSWAGARG